jgi:hypothetical protein
MQQAHHCVYTSRKEMSFPVNTPRKEEGQYFDIQDPGDKAGISTQISKSMKTSHLIIFGFDTESSRPSTKFNNFNTLSYRQTNPN